jgi:peptide/nickel transport system substrate-binding protein
MTCLRRDAARRLSGALACAVLLSACQAAPPDPSVLTVAIRTAPNTLDPRQGGDEMSQRVGELIFSPLMVIGPDLRAAPHLAERLDNPEPRTYVAHLRRGVRFHDGRALTATDVVYTFSALLDPGYVSPFKGAYSVLESVTALDDHTAVFRLKEPFAAFPIQLVQPPIVPAGSGDAVRARPIGSGPYRFVEYATDDHIRLAAFDDYFGGRPANAGLVLKVVPDDTMLGLELRRGSVDLVVNDLMPDIVHQLERDAALQAHTAPGVDFAYLGFNLRDPALRDRRVRQAIGYAIDRQSIVDHLRRGLGRLATGLLPSQNPMFADDVLQFTYDPPRAMALLDEAGYRDPDGPGPQPRLRLSLSTSTNEEARLQCSVIQEHLRRVGIEVDVRSSEFATFYQDVVHGRFQLFTLQWVGGSMVDPDILRRVYHSTQTPTAGGFNRGSYSNPDVDRLLDEASAAADEDARRRAYAAVQRLVAADAVYIPIWNKTNVMVARRGLTGLRLGPLGEYLPLREISRTTSPSRAPN